jgi:hypothetical protein
VPPVAVTVTESVTMVAPVSVLMREDGATDAARVPKRLRAAPAAPTEGGSVGDAMPAGERSSTQ